MSLNLNQEEGKISEDEVQKALKKMKNRRLLNLMTYQWMSGNTYMRFSLKVTRMDQIRNEIRGTAQIEPLENKIKETRLRWFGQVLRRDSG